MKQWRFLFCWLLGTAAVATAAARFAVWKHDVNVKLEAESKSTSRDSEAAFHEWMHANLELTDQQHEALTAAETAYESRRLALRAAIQQANEELAGTIRKAAGFTDDNVSAALNKLAAAQSSLQGATLEHFFTMKQSLSPAQQEKLLQWTHDSLLNH